jgi:hypothetical protein
MWPSGFLFDYLLPWKWLWCLVLCPQPSLCFLFGYLFFDNVKDMLFLQELRREVEVMDARGARGEGQRLVARAWVDPEFKKRLLQVTLTHTAH